MERVPLLRDTGVRMSRRRKVRGRDDTPDSATRSTHRPVLLDQMGACQCTGLRRTRRRAFGAASGRRLAARRRCKWGSGQRCQLDPLMGLHDLWRGRDRRSAVVLSATPGSLGRFVVSSDKPGLAGEPIRRPKLGCQAGHSCAVAGFRCGAWRCAGSPGRIGSMAYLTQARVEGGLVGGGEYCWRRWRVCRAKPLTGRSTLPTVRSSR